MEEGRGSDRKKIKSVRFNLVLVKNKVQMFNPVLPYTMKWWLRYQVVVK